MTRQQTKVFIAVCYQLQSWLNQHENNVQLMPSLVVLKTALDRLRKDHVDNGGGFPGRHYDAEERESYLNEANKLDQIADHLMETITAMIKVRTSIYSAIKLMEEFTDG